MNEDEMKILKLMNEMTARTDMNEFAKKLGLSSADIMQQMQDLAKEGYLRKIGTGFAITEKGKMTLKAMMTLPEGKEFRFYLALGQPTNLYARTINEFRHHALGVDVASLEFHLYRGDLENWFRTSVAEPSFAEELVKIRKTNLRGEELRKAILKAVDIKFGV